MNSEAIAADIWIAIGIGAVVFAVLAVAIFATRERKPAASTDAKLDELARQVGGYDQRFLQVEEKLKAADHDLRNVRAIVQNLPTKDSISRISEQVAETRGEITGMQGTLNSQSHSLNRIEDFLVRVSVEHIVGKAQGSNNGETR